VSGTVRDWAAWYIERGWTPVEIAFQTKRPTTTGWRSITIADAEANLDRMFPPNQARNIGIALGAPSGNLVDIDLDCPEANELAPLFLPKTLVFGRKSTPQSHWLYECPIDKTIFRDPLRIKKAQDKKKKGADDPNDHDDDDGVPALEDKSMIVEIRSTKGQTVFPPSIHKDTGEQIAFIDPSVQLTSIKPSDLQFAVERLAAACLFARYLPATGRHDTQLAMAGAFLLDGWSEEQTTAILCAIYRLNGNEDAPKRASTVASTLARIKDNQGVWGWKKLEDHYEKTLLRKVREWFIPVVDPNSFSSLNTATDVANARRFKTQHVNKLRYVYTWKKWIAWDGTRWNAEIADVIVQQAAEATALSIYDEATAAVNAGDLKKGTVLRNHATATCDARSIGRMIRQAQYQPGIPISHRELDTNNWLLTCTNGTLNLRTKVLSPHAQADLITKLCPTPYIPAAKAPTWTKTLLEMMGGTQELADFLQVAVGYATTACVKEECFIMLYGNGNNGKTTFLEAIQNVLGDDHASTVASDILLTKPGQTQHPTGLTDLYGKRFILSVEPDVNKALAEALIKSITGRDRIRARRMNEDFWEFKPTHTIFLACNHKPTLVGTDEGIKRRIKPVPFMVKFSKPNKEIPELLKSEASGILNWIVEGAEAYMTRPNSFDLPEKAQEFKDSYLAEQDRLREFFEDCVEDAHGERVESSLLWKTYMSWCNENGDDTVSRKAFGIMVEERGYPAHRGEQWKRYRKNMRLKGALAAVLKAFKPTLVR